MEMDDPVATDEAGHSEAVTGASAGKPLIKYTLESTHQMRKGLLFFCAGLAVTITTYLLASAGEGRMYLIAWGPMAFGPLYFIHGLCLRLTGHDTVRAERTKAPTYDRCPACGASCRKGQSYCQVCGRFLKA